MTAALAFDLPPALEAHEPPEARGLARDAVRLMVASRDTGEIAHAHFGDLPDLLSPGDVVVVNTSATLPAAIAATRPGGGALQVRFSTAAPDLAGGEWWLVELRSADGRDPRRDGAEGEMLTLAGGATLELAACYASGCRLWLARLDATVPLDALLRAHGEPVRYGYVPRRWPLSAYQTVYADEPGSAEMPSAGRPFSTELITRLVARGIHVAPVVLHTGVSSPERHEPPQPEPYRVPEATARLIGGVRYWGGRVIAVGTTVVRALETTGGRAGEGWTSLVIDAERGLRVVDGLITGWHEPRASHLQLLEAAAGLELLEASYREALAHGYLWHEFGDSHLIL